MIQRGGVYWIDLGVAVGSRPAKRRPVVVVQAEAFNNSRIATVIAVVISSNTDLGAVPGNVHLSAEDSGLPRDSVVNVTGMVTLDKSDLDERVGTVPSYVMADVDRGLKVVLGLR